MQNNNLKYEREENGQNGKVTCYLQGKPVGEILYNYIDPKVLVISHTEADPEYQGHGIGKGLVTDVADFARKEQLKVIPICPFAKVLFDRHPEWQDIRAVV